LCQKYKKAMKEADRESMTKVRTIRQKIRNFLYNIRKCDKSYNEM
jgi:hypothetical protein